MKTVQKPKEVKQAHHGRKTACRGKARHGILDFVKW